MYTRHQDQALERASKPLATLRLNQERYQSCQIKEKLKSRHRVVACAEELPTLKNSKTTTQHLKTKNLHIIHLRSLTLLQTGSL